MFWLSCREQKKIFDLKEQGGELMGSRGGSCGDGLGKPFDQTEQRGGSSWGAEGGAVGTCLGSPLAVGVAVMLSWASCRIARRHAADRRKG